jgi:FMN phosphatase YigB (HAD superfamily)
MSKVILTDCDGVLLDWEFAFDCWMQSHGFTQAQDGKLEYKISKRYDINYDQGKQLTKIFNSSASIGFLPALRDAIYYVKRLHEEHGYVFHCITSLSLDPSAQKLRKMNLDKLFGKTVFEKIVCLDTGADKDQALEPYRGSDLFWIEDKPKNADLGHELGLRSILLEHGHNMHHECTYPVVKNWKEIYNIIVDAEKY